MKKLFFAIKKITYKCTTLIVKIYAKLFRVKLGKNFKSNGIMTFWKSYQGSITIGDNVTINNTFHSNYVGLSHKTAIVVEGNGCITIGNFTGISGAIIHSKKMITIGEYVLIGGNVKIWDHDFHSHLPKERLHQNDFQIPSNEIKIGDHVFIGANSIILKGTTIGENSIIGAGSVVHGKIPPNEVWAGNPAKMIKSL